ncbi:hypothetical protein HJ01_03487 [Flavobacterium frigoris PS1]|uniref:Uncharacterized protein n=1 Tax=Flavobacterium frigoris (strain PS1) TaxID=1086011 RepID=H7FWE0_FLAFP|nr:hypothetical protein HJ01_03487 [Flavobacterium frigoris PS1]
MLQTNQKILFAAVIVLFITLITRYFSIYTFNSGAAERKNQLKNNTHFNLG